MAAATSGIYEYFLEALGGGDDGGTADDRARHGSDRARYGEWSDAAGRSHGAFLTWDTWIGNQIDMARSLDGLLGVDDVVIVALPYELTFVGAEVERAVELVGASVISVGTSNTICPLPRVLDLLWQYEATILMCSPTLAARLSALAAAQGRVPGDSSIRLIVALGEACSPERLDRVAAAWGAEAGTLYGTSLTPTVAVPCERGALHVCDRLRARVRDLPGAGVPVPERGELVLTGVSPAPADGADEQSGEFVALKPATSCGCGARGPVLVPLGRTADVVVSGSGPVSAVDVERVVFGFPEFAPQFAAAARDGGFSVTCAVPDGAAVDLGELRRTVRGRLGVELGVDVEVVVVETRDWEAATA